MNSKMLKKIALCSVGAYALLFGLALCFDIFIGTRLGIFPQALIIFYGSFGYLLALVVGLGLLAGWTKHKTLQDIFSYSVGFLVVTCLGYIPLVCVAIFTDPAILQLLV